MYAIQHGAKYIYDTDDNIAPIHSLSKFFDYDTFKFGLVLDCQNSSRIINPYAHFGQPLIWPRGFPLIEINENHSNNYIGGKRKTSTVQHGILNGDPDIDSIFRLTKSKKNKRIDVNFDESSPSIQLPSFRMTPYSSKNTLFHYQAFWSLYLPSTVSSRSTDIWRSYWAQRLLWLLDDTVTFFGPNAQQFHNQISLLRDFEEEKNMYSQTEKLIDFLFEWKCTKSKFYECVVQLSTQMAEKNFWDYLEVEAIKSWLKDLTEIGYKEPILQNTNLKTFNLCGSKQFQNISKVIFII